MIEGNRAPRRDRLLPLVARLVESRAVDDSTADLLREAIEDSARLRDLLAGNGAWMNLAIEPLLDADPSLPQIDRARITIFGDPATLLAGEFESRAMKSWINRSAGLGLREEGGSTDRPSG